MTTGPVAVDARSKREVFFKLLFGAASRGYVCVAFLSHPAKRMHEEFYAWPDELPQMLDAIEERLYGNNVYFCPQILDARKRTKEHVTVTPNAWADLDKCHPDLLSVPASVVVESSPDRWQAFWVFDRVVDPDDAEDLSRRIAYRHADDGADRSGWDLTQLVRVPETFNYKYADRMPTVKIARADRSRFRLADFSADYPDVSGYVQVEEELPNPETFQGLDADELLQQKRMVLNPNVWRYYNDVPEGDWSKILWNLEMLLFEAGYTREETFVICREAKCNKYARDQRSDNMLWKDVLRAHARSLVNLGILKGEESALKTPLVTEEERERALAIETFVERYQKWATSLGDAAAQYHQAGAFVALSSLLAGTVKLPTSFGTITPNLWFMILADTTLTRKSTAMDLAMELVMEVDPDVMLATDGSIEGLMTSLATRPNRPSVFLRDEFSGLLEQMVKKDYMAGMPEVLTKLYDCKPQKRLLRKETIDVRDPVLLIFAGGIKNKVTQILTFEQVSSGFMPRFVFVTAESDPSKVKPLGPPTTVIHDGRAEMLAELRNMAAFYQQTVIMEVDVGVTKAQMAVPRRFEAQLTQDAWVRYNKLEAVMMDDGLNSKRPDIMTPTYDRLCKSILKAAVLLAASRQRKDVVTVEETDVIRAIIYGEQWRRYADEVMNDVGISSWERLLEQIQRHIIRKPGSSRSVLMQNFHLSARDTNLILETLEQRGVISRHRQGRTEVLNPIDYVALTPQKGKA